MLWPGGSAGVHCREGARAQQAPYRCLGAQQAPPPLPRPLERADPPEQRAPSAVADLNAFGHAICIYAYTYVYMYTYAGAISLARVMTLAWQLSTEDQLDMYHQLSASLKQHGHLS